MRYKLIWNTENCCDGYELPWAETEEAAKQDLKDTYWDWAFQQQEDWDADDDGVFIPTETQIEHWDYMILNCYCYLVPWDENKGDFSENEEDEIYLSDEELWKIGWREWKDIARPYTKGERA